MAQAENEILLEKERYIDAVIGPQSYHQVNDIIIKLENNQVSLILQSLML